MHNSLSLLLIPSAVLRRRELFPGAGCAPRVRQLRSAHIQRARPLSEVARMAWDDDGDKARQDALRLLDLCTQAVNNKDEPLLPPLRSHFFHRASMVSGRAPTVPVEDAPRPRSTILAGPLVRCFWSDGSTATPAAVRCTNWCSAANVVLSISPLWKLWKRMPTDCNHACTIKMRTSSSRNWSL